MRVTGLSYQWGERLFEVFPEKSDRDTDYMLVPTVGRLLRHMLTIEGPDLWVLSSHAHLSFHAYDVQDHGERPPTLAWAWAYGEYHIQYPLPREFRQSEDFYGVKSADPGVEGAAQLLLRAIEYSDANPDRHSAKWHWYVCPECDLHSPEYLENCALCSYRFPDEGKCQAAGIWRFPKLPDGAVALTYAKNSQ